MVGLVLHGVVSARDGVDAHRCARVGVLLGGIGLIGLVAHGLFGTPPSARQTLTGQRAMAGQDGRGV